MSKSMCTDLSFPLRANEDEHFRSGGGSERIASLVKSPISHIGVRRTITMRIGWIQTTEQQKQKKDGTVMKKMGFLIAICALAYAASTGRPTPNSARSATIAGPVRPRLQQRNSLMIGPGDVMEVEFRFTPEFNQTVMVQPDGYITLNEIGDVHIQGMNTPEATESIRDASAKILHEPVVTVVLKDFDKPFFIANGQVRSPGKYELRSNLTVTQAIAVAGGFTDASKHSQVWLYHPTPNDQFEVKVLNLKRMLKEGDLAEDIWIQHGDMVFVPQNTLSKMKGFILPRGSLDGATFRR